MLIIFGKYSFLFAFLYCPSRLPNTIHCSSAKWLFFKKRQVCHDKVPSLIQVIHRIVLAMRRTQVRVDLCLEIDAIFPPLRHKSATFVSLIASTKQTRMAILSAKDITLSNAIQGGEVRAITATAQRCILSVKSVESFARFVRITLMSPRTESIL